MGPVGGSSPKRVMWMEWDGGEVPVGGEAIRDKDHRTRGDLSA